jgi:nucleotide-binding universal stress UspA family protein
VGRELEATLDLLYVDEGTERMYELRDPAVTAVLDREQMSIQDMLDQQLRRLRDSLPEDVRGEALLQRGRATDEILQLARGRDAVLIGTHGRRGWSHLQLGSVAERVVRSSPVPVLVLPVRGRGHAA